MDLNTAIRMVRHMIGLAVEEKNDKIDSAAIHKFEVQLTERGNVDHVRCRYTTADGKNRTIQLNLVDLVGVELSGDEVRDWS